MRTASFTQTYGDQRILELLLLKYDIIGNTFRNKCDKIFFSFHNCPNEFIIKGKTILEKLYPSDKLIILEYNNISYLETIKKTLNNIKTMNIDYILQIQDDQFGINSKQNIDEINNINMVFNFINNKKPYFLHIFGNEGDPKFNNMKPLQIFTNESENNSTNDIEFYNYNTKDFAKNNIYSWNDGTYFANVDFLINIFNTKNLPENVWDLEHALKYIFDNNNLNRIGTNKLFFKASNLHGRNINNKLNSHENLQNFFGELDDWENIKNIITNNI
jgi:hypothetical protein